MTRSARLRWLSLAVAPAGILFGHWLTYTLLIRSPGERAQLLTQSGHHYLAFGVKVAAALGLAAVAATATRQLRERSTPPLEMLRWLAPRLVALQVAGFAGMEVLERLTAGQPVSGVELHGLLGVGLVVQFVVALVLAAALLRLGRAVATFAERLRRPVRRSTSTWVGRSRPGFRPVFALAAGGAGERAPPAR